RSGTFGEPAIQRQRTALGIHGQRSAAGRIHADADDLLRLEPAHRAPRGSESLLNRGLCPSYVIRRMLAGQVRVTGEYHAIRAVGIIPNRRRDLTAIRGI